MSYLGTLGRMVQIYSNPSMEVESTPRYRYQTTLEGKRKAQATRATRRSWSLSGEGAHPQDVGALAAFADGEWGIGPFVWVSPDAPLTNMLAPAVASGDASASITAGVTMGGPLLTPDGWAGRSWSADGTRTAFFGNVETSAPVLPGVKVTGAAYVQGAGAFARINWYNSAGAFLTSSSSSVIATAGTVVRSWVTATPPTGAVSAIISAANATRMARPSLTWTGTLRPWANGRGCPKAVVDSSGETVQRASHNGGIWSNLEFTITEVG